MRKFVFMILVFLMTVFAVNIAFGSADKNKTNVYYEEITISRGESYWDIAGKYDSDGMTRAEYMNYIMKFNEAHTDTLKAGQKIIVPVIKYI